MDNFLVPKDMIDPIEFEQRVLRYQNPMNAVIGRGDSDVQTFYHDATVFVTGGLGFIGKQLIEKLLRACKIKKLYTLIRSKREKTIQERLNLTLTDPVFDILRQQQPSFADRIVPVAGDVADLQLGLSDEDRAELANEVTIIFHAAATVRFDEPIRKATLTNVRGTREVVQLARECKKLKKLIHISTAFCHATKANTCKDVGEKYYQCPVPPAEFIKFAEEVDEDRLDNITNDLIEGWPNTYTFTKAIAEELIRTTAGDLPVCIVRPPVVTAAYYEPQPGWLDANGLNGPSGLYLAIGLGVLHVLCVDVNTHLSMAPVDYVNNAIIAAAWDSTQRQTHGNTNIPIYTISKKDFFQWKFLGHVLRTKAIKMAIPAAIWNCGLIETKNKLLSTILSWFIHYIPAYVLDFICQVIGKKPKDISSFVDVYRKVDKLGGVYNYFMTNEWNFRDDNLQDMLKRMSDADKAIFNCDMDTIDGEEYVIAWAVGLRKYILKDGLKNTKHGLRKQAYFRILNTIAVVLYLYILWWVFSTILMIFI